MVGRYESFFMASAGASAAILGLLVVAGSVVISGIVRPGALDDLKRLGGAAAGRQALRETGDWLRPEGLRGANAVRA